MIQLHFFQTKCCFFCSFIKFPLLQTCHYVYLFFLYEKSNWSQISNLNSSQYLNFNLPFKTFQYGSV